MTVSRPTVSIEVMDAKTTTESVAFGNVEKAYHHGDLPAALRAATAELITEKGPTGFSLREVARRAGVSHSAPAHHFGDSLGLLTSVAAEGFRRLNDAFGQLQAIADPIERLNAMGKAYIHVAIENPGHFGVMCSHELVDHDNEEFCNNSGQAFESLVQTVAEIAEAHNPKLDVEVASTWIWSTVHGLAVLRQGLTTMEIKAVTNEVDVLIDQFTDLMTNGLFRGTGNV